MNDLINRVKKDSPMFHTDRNGRPVSFSVSAPLVSYLQARLRQNMNTLETGCGLTTVVFAVAGCRHCCVTPRAEETRRVGDYCGSLGVSTSRLKFVVGRSERVLPGMWDDEPLQFVFIDGAHRFPDPILDFHYTQHRLQLGGVVAVDDINIRSVRMLYDFLSIESEWKRIKVIGETAFFERVQEPRDVNWDEQRFNQVTSGERVAGLLRRLTVRKILQKLRLAGRSA